MDLSSRETQNESAVGDERSDEQLLVRYRDASDVCAFEELVHRYERPIYRYLARYLGNAALAEEVFQATFQRVHEKCGMFSEGRRVRPWLYSIATHQAIDALRRESRHQSVSLNETHGLDGHDPTPLIALLESHVPTPLQQIEQHERAAWARRAVDRLPLELRAVILLIYFHGFKYQAAAEALEIPLGTVKSRVHKALLLLNESWWKDHRAAEDEVDAR